MARLESHNLALNYARLATAVEPLGSYSLSYTYFSLGSERTGGFTIGVDVCT